MVKPVYPPTTSLRGVYNNQGHFCYCISKTKNEFGQNPEENIKWTVPGLYTAIWTGSLTDTNSGNINVKYNINKYDVF